MAVSYNKLWKLLIDKKMSAADLRRAAVIAPNTRNTRGRFSVLMKTHGPLLLCQYKNTVPMCSRWHKHAGTVLCVDENTWDRSFCVDTKITVPMCSRWRGGLPFRRLVKSPLLHCIIVNSVYNETVPWGGQPPHYDQGGRVK